MLYDLPTRKLCPYGNVPGELFCTKGLIVNSKVDMCNLFDNSDTYKVYGRVTSVADNCDEYSQFESESVYRINELITGDLLGNIELTDGMRLEQD